LLFNGAKRKEQRNVKMLLAYATDEERRALKQAKQKLNRVYRSGTSAQIMAEEARMNNFHSELLATLMHRAKVGVA
jgi:hypothetical protein